MLLVVNQDDRNVSLIDATGARQIAVVPVTGTTGHEAAVFPGSGIAFVPIYGNSGVGKPGTDGSYMDVIDILNRKVVGRVDFGRGVRPHCAVFDPNSGLLFVTTELDQTVTIVDPRTLKITGSIPTGQGQSHMLVLSHDGRRGYTANVGPGTVSVLDMKARKTIAIIPVSGETQRIAISKDDRKVFTADQTKPRLAVIDTATNKVGEWIALPAVGYGTAVTNDGRWLIATIPSLNQLAVVDLETLKVVHSIDVGKHPTEVLVRPDGLVAYVACMGSHQIAAIDLAHWKVQAMIDAGHGADGLAWYQ